MKPANKVIQHCPQSFVLNHSEEVARDIRSGIHYEFVQAETPVRQITQTDWARNFRRFAAQTRRGRWFLVTYDGVPVICQRPPRPEELRETPTLKAICEGLPSYSLVGRRSANARSGGRRSR